MASGACGYQQFDPMTLTSSNPRTRQRLLELERILPELAGRSVLDLGANHGLVSLLAAQRGARRVRAVEKNAESVAAIREACRISGLPVEVEHRSVWDMPDHEGAEVVLALEILHWLVFHGATPGEAIAKLCALTERSLFIETPWEAPPVAEGSKRTFAAYDIRAILESLLEEGFSVEVLHFCRYTGRTRPRVMLRADRR
ncbi:MAG: hypothetical protein RLZZ272_1666 [Actinomycetota bacterium]